MTKSDAMLIAAVLTNASVGGAATTAGLKVNPDGTLDNTVKAENLMVWEVFRVYYRGVIGAAANEDRDVGFPPPADPSAPAVAAGQGQAALKELLAVLKGAAGAAGPIATAVGGPGAGAVAGAIGSAINNIPDPTVPPPAAGPSATTVAAAGR